MGVTDSSTPLRPTGQLPVSPAADAPDPAGRDINITWWYTFLSVAGMSIFLLGIGAVVPIALMTASDGPTWQIVVVLIFFTATCVERVCFWLIRDG